MWRLESGFEGQRDDLWVGQHGFEQNKQGARQSRGLRGLKCASGINRLLGT